MQTMKIIPDQCVFFGYIDIEGDKSEVYHTKLHGFGIPLFIYCSVYVEEIAQTGRVL